MEDCEDSFTFGFYSFGLLLLVGLAGASLMSLNGFVINFLGTRSDHWCTFTQALTETQMEFWREFKRDAKSCAQYEMTTGASQTEFTVINESCHDGWTFDTSERSITYISEWRLVCEDAWLTDLVVPAYIGGQLLGSLGSGLLANRFGRKSTLLMSMLVVAGSGVASAFSINIYMYLASRFLIGTGSITMLCQAFLFGKELVPNKYGFMASVLVQLAFPFGLEVTALVSYLVRDWRPLQLCVAVLTTPFMLLILLFLPESPRWLMSQGRTHEAAEILIDVAKKNGAMVHIPRNTEETMNGSMGWSAKIDTKNNHKVNKSIAHDDHRKHTVVTSLKDLLLNSMTRYSFLTICFTWSTCTFIFSAVSYNLDRLFGDIYINMIAFGAIDIAIILLVAALSTGLGRNFIIQMLMGIAAVGGVGSIVVILLEGPPVFITATAVVSRSSAFGWCYVVQVIILDLFPTHLRGTVTGLANAWAYTQAFIAPYTASTLDTIWKPAPYMIYTLMIAVASILLCWLPETRNAKLPETVQELEAMARSQSQPQPKTIKKDISAGIDNAAFSLDISSSLSPPHWHNAHLRKSQRCVGLTYQCSTSPYVVTPTRESTKCSDGVEDAVYITHL